MGGILFWPFVFSSYSNSNDSEKESLSAIAETYGADFKEFQKRANMLVANTEKVTSESGYNELKVKVEAVGISYKAIEFI